MGRGELLQLSGKITHNLWIFLLFPQFARQTKRNVGCIRDEFCVNVSRFSALLVGSYGESCVAEKTKRQRDEETKRRRVKETKSQRDEGSKRRREEETKGREDENRVISYSCPLHSPIRSILIQFVSKNIREIRVQNSFTPENTVS